MEGALVPLLLPLLSAPFRPRISLNTLTLNVKSEKVYTRHGVPISVTGIAQVGLRAFLPKPAPTPFSWPLSALAMDLSALSLLASALATAQKTPSSSSSSPCLPHHTHSLSLWL